MHTIIYRSTLGLSIIEELYIFYRIYVLSTGILTNYRITVTDRISTPIVAETRNTSYRTNNLLCCTTYYFSVEASTRVGYGIASDTFMFNTQPDLQQGKNSLNFGKKYESILRV